MRVLIAAGGTGGHVYPGVALARTLRDRGHDVVFIGREAGIESDAAQSEGFEVSAISVIGSGGKLRNLIAAWKLFTATLRSRRILREMRPSVIVGMGGYVSLPPALAARLLRIPLVVHEQNSIPGLANRLAARFARTVAVSFPSTAQSFSGPAVVTGNPIRSEIAHLDRAGSRAEAIEHFGLDPERRTLLVFGGSQGARSINTALLRAYGRMRAESRLQVLHIAGRLRMGEVELQLSQMVHEGDRVLWRVVAYTDRMDLAYAAADLAVCRAGATSIAELAAVGLPAVLVPLPHSMDSDQMSNAKLAGEAGGAVLVEDSELPAAALSMITEIVFDEKGLGDMSQSIGSMAAHGAAEKLADLVEEVTGTVPRGRSLPWLDAAFERVHLVGAGGAGMSAIAAVLSEAGYEVTGSDARDSSALGALRRRGMDVRVGHSPGNVGDATLVISSAAVPPDNAELAESRNRGLEVLGRGEALGRITAGFRTVAVTGTHGKSTTTAMVVSILEAAGLSPTYLIGADLAGSPGGRMGTGDLAVVEADEAYGSFLHLKPEIAVITNVDSDHLDFYSTRENLLDAFKRFVAGVSGAVMAAADDEAALVVTSAAARRITFGTGERADVRATGILSSASESRFSLEVGGNAAGEILLSVGGLHNVRNALGAAAAALEIGLPFQAIREGLEKYRGVGRRFEYRGALLGAWLVDDYAHHPTAISANLQAARGGPWRRIVVVFQPHLYSRTRDLAGEFGAALSGADMVVITDVYGAREEPLPGVTGKTIVDAVCQAAPGRRVAYMENLDDAARYVRSVMREGDLILSMGAGDVTTFHGRLAALGPAR